MFCAYIFTGQTENEHSTTPKTPFEEAGGCSEILTMENGWIKYVQFVKFFIYLCIKIHQK